MGASMIGVLLVSAPAQASTYPPLGMKTLSRPYSKSFCHNSKELKRGITEKLSGTVRYKRNAYKFNRGIRVRFYDPTLVNPTITVTTTNKCGKGAKAAKVDHADLTQKWYDWKCQTTVAVFVGYPWAVGVSGTYKCGKTKAADRNTGPYGKGSHYTQYNSGAPVRWSWGSDGKGITKGGKICLHADAAATVYIRNRSDMASQALDVCVTASWGSK
ncbi:hypothetical protein NE236_35025 [Actinoallomurus purpureus]|uniref:hypothetical protein n=1 Tax=Actinoallomurus purpureus TaxID=478114 RepID=UPI0020932543|nr:hypothetical protein [Actinoallomurus purpureus]MCO6010191.1 hypothetical protein [Actinoallomurus purpureus]